MMAPMHPRVKYDVLRLVLFLLAGLIGVCFTRSCSAQDGRVWHSAPPPLNMRMAGTELRMAAWKGGTAALCLGFGYGAEELFSLYTSSDAPRIIRYVGLSTALYFGGRSVAHGVRAGHHLAMEAPAELYELPGE